MPDLNASAISAAISNQLGQAILLPGDDHTAQRATLHAAGRDKTNIPQRKITKLLSKFRA